MYACVVFAAKVPRATPRFEFEMAQCELHSESMSCSALHRLLVCSEPARSASS